MACVFFCIATLLSPNIRSIIYTSLNDGELAMAKYRRLWFLLIGIVGITFTLLGYFGVHATQKQGRHSTNIDIEKWKQDNPNSGTP
ncbi:MAG: hypothetical protein COA80_14840 [Leeuwenhoekiella sp.]|nr:MAG: hypothetical protein COA80_14840 [Leeuwenhoekiella sp.]